MAEIDHHHLIGDVAHDREVVGDEQIGELELLLQLGQQVQHLGADRHVERRHRLVQDEDLGAQHQGTRNGDALALAAREHVRVAVGEFRPQPDAGHHVGCGGAALGRRHVGVDEQRLFERGPDGLARVERAIGVLEDDLHLAAQAATILGGGGGEVDAIDAQRAGGRLLDHRHQPGQGRLAGAGFADHRQRAAGRQVERNAGQRLDGGGRGEHATPGAVVARQVAAFEHDGHAATSRLEGTPPTSA